jgi:uncharacterized protein YjcR
MNNLYERSRGLQQYDLTPDEIFHINSIEYEQEDRAWVMRQVMHYLVNDWPLDILAKNYLRIRSLGRDGNSVRAWVIRTGWEVGVGLFEEKVRQTKTPLGRFGNIKKDRK